MDGWFHYIPVSDQKAHQSPTLTPFQKMKQAHLEDGPVKSSTVLGVSSVLLPLGWSVKVGNKYLVLCDLS
jgi:hypothetical protein